MFALSCFARTARRPQGTGDAPQGAGDPHRAQAHEPGPGHCRYPRCHPPVDGAASSPEEAPCRIFDRREASNKTKGRKALPSLRIIHMIAVLPAPTFRNGRTGRGILNWIAGRFRGRLRLPHSMLNFFKRGQLTVGQTGSCKLNPSVAVVTGTAGTNSRRLWDGGGKRRVKSGRDSSCPKFGHTGNYPLNCHG